MLWEHEPQASVSTAYSSSPKLSQVCFTTDGKIFVKPDPINDVIVKIQSDEDLNKL